MSKLNYKHCSRKDNNLTRGCDSLVKMANNLSTNLGNICTQLTAAYIKAERNRKPEVTYAFSSDGKPEVSGHYIELAGVISREYGLIPLV